MKLYKILSLVGAITLTSAQVVAASAPPLTLQPVSVGQETARYDKGVATVSLKTPQGAVEIRPLPLRDGKTLSFNIAVYNQSGRAANFGTENIRASFDGMPARVLTAEQLADAAKDKARTKQIGTMVLAGVVAGIASTASTTHTDYRAVHTRHHGTYARAITWEDNTIGTVGAVAAVGVGAAAVVGIDKRLDYTLDQIDGQTLQTTTVNPNASLGGVVTVGLAKEDANRSGMVNLTIDWNGQSYPFTFRLAAQGASAPMPATQPDGYDD